MPICKACANEADDRAEMGNAYMDEVVRGSIEDQKKYGHYCGHACCDDYSGGDCPCHHEIPGGALRND